MFNLFSISNPVKGLYKYIKVQFDIINDQLDTIDENIKIVPKKDEVYEIKKNINTLLKKVNEIGFILDPHIEEEKYKNQQKEVWKEFHNKNILFSLNIFLQPYNYSIAIDKEGQAILYNKSKKYTQEETNEFFKRLNNNVKSLQDIYKDCNEIEKQNL